MAVTKKNMAIAAAKKESASEAAAKPEPPVKKPKTVLARYIILKNGERYRILREDGKYLYCDGTTIRHLDPRIERRENIRETAEGKE